MRKITSKIVAVCLAATMMLSLAACSGNKKAESDVDDAVVSESTAEVAEDADNTEATDDTADVEDTGAGTVTGGDLEVAWATSHSSEDFTLSDMYAVNSVTNLAPAGSGKAVKVHYTAYDQVQGDNGVTLSTEPSYEANFYQWFDDEGRLNWVREVVASPDNTNNAWNLVDTADGYGMAATWSGDTVASRTVYTNTDYQMAVCDTFYPLYTLDNSSSPFNYDPSKYVEAGDTCEAEKKASTWNLPMNDSNGTSYTAYLNDEMVVQALIEETMFGDSVVVVPSIVDISEAPELPDVETGAVDCTMDINGNEVVIPLMTDVKTAIFTGSSTAYAVNEKITTDKAVTIVGDDGADAGTTTEITNNENTLMDFKVSEPTKFTITYEYPADTAEANSESEASSTAE